MTIFGEKIGARIASARKEKDLTQTDLAGRLGISLNSTYRMEKGERLPDANEIIRIGEIVDKSPNWLLTGTDDGGTPARPVHSVPVLDRLTPDVLASPETHAMGMLAYPEAPPGCVSVKLSGDHMAPRLLHGDYVLFHIGAVSVGDLAVYFDKWAVPQAAWLRERQGTKYLVPENQQYGSVEVGDEIRIIGRVVGAFRAIALR